MRLFKIFLSFCLGLILTLIPQLSWGMNGTPQLTGGMNGTPRSPLSSSDLTIAPIETPIGRSSLDFVSEGTQSYDAGQFARAAQLWQQAIHRFEEEGSLLEQAQVLSFLSLAYQRLGEYREARQAIAHSKNIINSLFSKVVTVRQATVYAQILNTEGRLQYTQGNSESALETWQAATEAYALADDRTGMILSQVNQARALEALGFYRRATKILEEIKITLKREKNPSLKSAVLLTLGDLLRQFGSLKESNSILLEAMAIANQSSSQGLIPTSQKIAILMSLGNTAKALGNIEKAVEFYQESETLASVNGAELFKLQAQLNRLTLLLYESHWETAEALADNILIPLTHLPMSRPAVYTQVNLAKNLICLAQEETNCLKQEDRHIGEIYELSLIAEGEKAQAIQESIALLENAVTAARSLQDSRAESYALGTLAEVYEEMGEVAIAQQYTESALNIAQSFQASDIAYQWQWQLGRLFAQGGETKQAIVAYSEAVKTLQSLRSDLVAAHQEVQFSFRESVEPLYRQLVELLLQPELSISDPKVPKPISQENLKKARKTIESLQLAELDNFFRDACLDAEPQQIDQIDPQAAVIYPIILPQRFAVIFSIPGKPLGYYETQVTQSKIEYTLGQFQQFLSTAFSTKQRLEVSQKVYDWLIRPAENELAATDADTLVFVLDGMLRNLPMAALYDGEQYLIEKYSIALTPGLQLLEASPLQPETLKVLTGGLTEGRQGHPALPAVELELEAIATNVETRNFASLLDREFTELNLLQELDRVDFPIVHLATHGQFSSRPEETFILTWDEKLQVKEFESLLKIRQTASSEPIELLVLSACQTAAGDRRAALGLAGVAVRSGARSTLATLWSVNDKSTADLVAEFYRYLLGEQEHLTGQETQTRITKAKALRQAQLHLLHGDVEDYQHPFYWSPFVLVGNWL